jgi:tRNA(Arg) A34 adenosine deaminase TadA
MSGHELDLILVRRAVAQAEAAEAEGNLPVGAVLALGETVVAEAGNALLVPCYHPGRHAEIEALGRVPAELWPRAAELTCYTTLEPCIMCTGTLILHGVGRVVFGAVDPEGGGGQLVANLPRFYDQRRRPSWEGPLLPEVCDALYARAAARFNGLPCASS